MNSEELLKNISGMIRKHESFLAQNPEIFETIQDRLLKAIDDDYDYDYTDDGDMGFGGDDLFDQVPQDEDYGDATEYVDIDSDNDYDTTSSDISATTQKPKIQEQIADVKEEKPKKQYGRQWKPRDLSFIKDPKRLEDIQSKMKNLTNEGFTHREAERIMDLHERPTSMEGHLFSNLQPSDPSEKMLSMLKEHSTNALSKYHNKKDIEADPSKNPVRYASGKSRSDVSNLYSDFHSMLDQFKNSKEFQSMGEDDQDDAIEDFTKDWHTKNKENLISGESTKGEASEARKKYLDEQKEALLSGGTAGADEGALAGEASKRTIEQEAANMNMSDKLNEFIQSDEFKNMSDEEQDSAYDNFVDYLTQQSDEPGQMTDEAGIQMAGGSRDQEGQAQVGIEKNPFASIAQKDPQLAEKLKNWQYNQQRVKEIADKNPEVISRMKQLGVKKAPEGGE